MIRIFCLFIIINIGYFASSGEVSCDVEKGFCIVVDLILSEEDSYITFTGSSWEDKLICKNSSLLSLPPRIFTQIPNLKMLDLSETGINYINPDAFTDAYLLTWLNISGNNIKNITESVFSGAKKLDTIDLSFNRISKLSESCFNGLKVLRALNLTDNELNILPAGIFVDTIAIEVLNLKGNQIVSLESNLFAKMDHLREIVLSENRLVDVDVNIFQNAQTLYSIDLSNNQLTKLVLNISNTIEKVLVGFNRIQKFSLNCSKIPEELSQSNSCDQLKILNLTHNNLNEFQNVMNLIRLEELDLSDNYIGKINSSMLALLKNLQKLNLMHTNLTGLTYGTFLKQTKLKSLDLSDNNLQTLNLDILLPYMYHTLQELYIAGNNLSEFSGRYTFQSFSVLSKLNLRRNNFNCSYLFELIVSMDSKLFVDFNNDNINYDIVNRSYIHGIECHLGRESFSSTTEKLEDNDTTVHHLKLQQGQLLQNLTKLFEERHYNNSQSLNHLKFQQDEMQLNLRDFFNEQHYNDSQSLKHQNELQQNFRKFFAEQHYNSSQSLGDITGKLHEQRKFLNLFIILGGVSIVAIIIGFGIFLYKYSKSISSTQRAWENARILYKIDQQSQCHQI